MTIKRVRVTNPRNVLVQVPGFVVAQWGVRLGDELDVKYNEDTGEVTIGKAIHNRGRTDEGRREMAKVSTGLKAYAYM